VSFDQGRSLVPFRGSFAPRPASGMLLGYIAVKHKGYWAESFLGASDAPSDKHTRARSGLEAALRFAAPGIRAANLYAQAMRPLGTCPLHPVLSSSVGRRIGFSANEGGALTADAHHILDAGDVYALHVGTCDAQSGAIASALVLITPQGNEVLLRAP
jgi:Xaa-Pro aminopeptidase